MKTFADWLVPGSLVLSLCLLAGCSEDPTPDSGTEQSRSSEAGEAEAGVLRLASTTSTRDSGLFEVLLPAFEKESHCRVDLIAVGTGACLLYTSPSPRDVRSSRMPSSA